MDSQSLIVAEMFGPTFQGEGPSTGQTALFVRLSRCNLSCLGCDTPYTWDWTRFNPQDESRRIGAAEVVAWLLSHPVRLVVITGGEPLLQQAKLVPVVAELTAAGRRVEIETNGTVTPHPDLWEAGASFNVSPKLATFAAEKDSDLRINPDALGAFVRSGQAVFKFVVTCPADLDEIGRLEAAHELRPVWVMPEGTTTGTTVAVMRSVADDVLARGWHLTSRMHVLLWGDTRGR
jgi:7-carboxy-7-deazaguanine synthase